MHTDLNTGQELFTPKINKNPNQKPLKSPSRTQPVQKRFSRSLTSENSEKILKRIKFLRFKALFSQFFPENEKITYETIKKAQISKKLSQILTPLTDGLRVQQISLDFPQFCVEMEELMKILTPEQKNYIIKGGFNTKERSKTASPTFRLRNSDISENNFAIYERNLTKMSRIKEKVDKMREEKESAELRSCSFSPKIKKLKPYNRYHHFLDTSLDIYERNTTKLSRSKEKIEKMREQKIFFELKSCTFKPKINNYVPHKTTQGLWALYSESAFNYSFN